MVVFLVFWGFLVWFLINKSNLELWLININFHAITLALIWIDYFLNYNISDKKNTIYILIYSLIYIVFNICYCLLTGHLIYPIMNWKSYSAYIVCIFNIGILIFIQFYL